MAKCKFCTTARSNMDATVEVAQQTINDSLRALDHLQKTMDDKKWGRRKSTTATPYHGVDRRASRTGQNTA